jgi:hypothetical protein
MYELKRIMDNGTIFSAAFTNQFKNFGTKPVRTRI